MLFVFLCSSVPRKLFIDRFESAPETDEPLPFDDNEQELDEVYDEDQFYKESDPAPKLQSDLSQKPQKYDTQSVSMVSSSISPPQHAHDESSINGMYSTSANLNSHFQISFFIFPFLDVKILYVVFFIALSKCNYEAFFNVKYYFLND
jgi:hypothetical protein